jgi:hypothetical protein
LERDLDEQAADSFETGRPRLECNIFNRPIFHLGCQKGHLEKLTIVIQVGF